jgi:hypothetical protein
LKNIPVEGIVKQWGPRFIANQLCSSRNQVKENTYGNPRYEPGRKRTKNKRDTGSLQHIWGVS